MPEPVKFWTNRPVLKPHRQQAKPLLHTAMSATIRVNVTVWLEMQNYLYMEVREDCRRKGFGSFLVQELKRACYLAGRVPAARCSIRNRASRATLIKAGLRACGFMLKGDVVPDIRPAKRSRDSAARNSRL